MAQSSMPNADSDTPGESDGVEDSGSKELPALSVAIDLRDITHLVGRDDDYSLTASRIIPAERGYSIEQLHNNDMRAWEKVAERFLKIAVSKYQDIVHFYLPGVDKEDAMSAVPDILQDLQRDVAKYGTVEEFDAAFRKALVRDIKDLYRKFLTIKRGAGNVTTTSELQGLETTDEAQGGSTDPEDEKAPSTREGKLNRELFDWESHLDTSDASLHADEKRIKHEALNEMSDEEKQILTLRFAEQLKHREIGARTGKNPKQIGAELLRAEEKLRKLVANKILNEKKHLL